MKTIIASTLGGALAGLVLGCASAGPSPELIDARRAYDQARMSDAKDYAPDRLLGAKEALDAAERAHADDAGSGKEKDLAYVATRRAELARAYGELLKDQKAEQQEQANYVQTQDRLRRQAEHQAENSQRSLEATQSALARTQNQLSASREQLTAAEQRANAAIQSLRQIANVQEEKRGLVITLEGSVLFVTGKSELVPLAQQKLDEVAQALKDSDSQKIVVEGYTDSRGSDDANMKLSQQRAESVRNYLVSKGVRPERISAVGKGEQSPVASNDTPEGRANNRRVEIVVSPESTSGSGGPGVGMQPGMNSASQSNMTGSGSPTGSTSSGTR